MKCQYIITCLEATQSFNQTRHQPRRMSVVQSPCTRFLLIFGPSLAVEGCSKIDPRLHCDQRLSRDYTDLAEGGPNLIPKALNYLGQTRG